MLVTALTLLLTASADAGWTRDDGPGRITLTRQAEAEVTGWNDQTALPELVIACDGRRLRAVLQAGLPIEVYGDDHDEYLAPVRIGLDGGPLERDRLRRGMGTGELFFGRARTAIRSWLGRDELVVEFSPSNGAPARAVFDLTGLGEAVAPLRERCRI